MHFVLALALTGISFVGPEQTCLATVMNSTVYNQSVHYRYKLTSMCWRVLLCLNILN